ncbi:MAG: Gmad2 immunoglobulin-like domain-containing protein [Nocardioidaceae bacterium]
MSTDNPTPNTGDNPNDHTAELLSQALNEEAAMVHTDPSALHEIQQRTQKTSHSRRPWIYAGVGAAAATAAVLVGVSVLGDHTQDSSGGPASTGKPTNTSAVQNPPVDVTVTYLGSADNGYRLVTEQHSVADRPGAPRLLSLMEFMDGQPTDPDYSSGWPAGIQANKMFWGTGTIGIDLTGPAGALDSADPSYSQAGRALAVQALLRSADAKPGERATFTYNGQPLSEVLGVRLPVTVASDDETRAWISIDNVTDGETLSNPVSVQVSGNVFEGNVNWQLLDGNGTKVDEGYVTTSMGQWTQASIDLGTLDPGTYTIRCLEFSPKDGKPGNVDDKTFTVAN